MSSYTAVQLKETINGSPILQSMLYDLNLLPEQVKEGSLDYARMAVIVEHVAKLLEQAATQAGGEAVAWKVVCKNNQFNRGMFYDLETAKLSALDGDTIIPLFTHPQQGVGYRMLPPDDMTNDPPPLG